MLALLLTACSGQSLGEGRGGLPATQVARASLVVAQTRAQFPQLSGAQIPFQTLPPPEGAAAPELALRGRGTAVEPGLQRGAPETLEATLSLEKTGYARGYLDVVRGTAAAERWPIMAYDLRGDPRERFHFTYVLLAPDERLHYLVLIGGRYEADGAAHVGYEGTLIEPGRGGDLEHWKAAFKLDFGFRHAVVPAHQRKVQEAVALFGQIERGVGGMERLSQRITAAEGELATLRAATPPPAQAGAHAQALRGAETRMDALQAEREGLVIGTQAQLQRYYELRKAIAEEFAAYTTGNAYLWRDRAGRQGVYDAWKVVEFHHPRIDELVTRFIPRAKEADGARLLMVRQAAMDAIAQHNNWAKDPSKAPAKPAP